MSDLTARCLAWRNLLDHGQVRWHNEFVILEQAGIVRREKNTAVLVAAEELQLFLNDPVFSDIQTTVDAAQSLVSALGLQVRITDRAEDCLRLLTALENTNQSATLVWRQQLSAELFGDSKYIANLSILDRIFKDWLGLQPSRGELRLKAFSSIAHQEKGPDLAEVTNYLGQAVLLSNYLDPKFYDLRGVDLVVTCENLAPFLDLSLGHGLLLYTGGYASRAVGHWLKALPKTCSWVHLGDFDPDGLGIFEHLVMVSDRSGRFFPGIATLELLKNDLPPWQGARTFQSGSLQNKAAQALANWGAKHKVQAEQEQILAQLKIRKIDVVELLGKGEFKKRL